MWDLLLQHVGLVALGHVGSYFPDQGFKRTYVPCFASWILNHWSIREAHLFHILDLHSLFPGFLQLLLPASSPIIFETIFHIIIKFIC